MVIKGGHNGGSWSGG